MHRFKKISRESMPPNPPSNAHGFAMRNMSLRDMQIPKSEKKILGPPPNPGDAPGRLTHFLKMNFIETKKFTKKGNIIQNLTKKSRNENINNFYN